MSRRHTQSRDAPLLSSACRHQIDTSTAMIYKLIAAALVVSSGEALKLNSVGMSRRTAVAKAATLALPLVSMPASAELKRAQDAELYKVRATCDGPRGRQSCTMGSHASRAVVHDGQPCFTPCAAS